MLDNWLPEINKMYYLIAKQIMKKNKNMSARSRCLAKCDGCLYQERDQANPIFTASCKKVHYDLVTSSVLHINVREIILSHTHIFAKASQMERVEPFFFP